MRPLDGITVVALEQAVAAPFASRHLADLGARVIKVERPGIGDFAREYDTTVRGCSSHFVWLNRSKESLTLNLKHLEARAILDRLLSTADVFLHNLAPGAVDRFGFAAVPLRARYPHLIICAVSGYGPVGPYRNRKAYDLLVQAEAGLLTITGTPNDPAKAGISVADISAGTYALVSILTALYVRAQTGQGTVLDISMLEALGEWMGYPAYFTAYGGQPPPRTGAHHAAIAPYGPYLVGDGHQIFLAVQNDREWRRFCETVIEQPDWVADPRFVTNADRVRHRADLDNVIMTMFAERTMDEVVARLDRAQIAWANLNEVQDFWKHPQLAARDRWRTVPSPVGILQTLLPPMNGEGWEPRLDPIPAVGEHTEQVLGTLGYSAEAIAQLRADGVI